MTKNQGPENQTSQNGPLFPIFLAIFLANTGLTGIYPLIPLYVKQLDSSYVELWSGLIVGVPFLLSALMGPIWSKLAQTFGYRRVLSLQAFLVAAFLSLQPLAKTAFQLLLIRAFGNLFAGLIAASFGYISFFSNKNQIGRNLAHGSIASSMGFILGPGFLGVVAARFGFESAFHVSSGLLFLTFFLFLFSMPAGPIFNWSQIRFDGFFSRLFGDIHLPRVRNAYLFVLVLFTFLGIPATLEGLLASDLLRSTHEAALWVGQISTLGAVLGLGLSFLISKWVDRTGYQPILIATLVGTAISTAAMGLNKEFVPFAIAFVVNVVLQCEFNTLVNLLVIDRSTDKSQGQAVVSTFSIIKIGNFLGAVLAGAAAQALSYQSVFLIAALGLIGAALLVRGKLV